MPAYKSAAPVESDDASGADSGFSNPLASGGGLCSPPAIGGGAPGRFRSSTIGGGISTDDGGGSDEEGAPTGHEASTARGRVRVQDPAEASVSRLPAHVSLQLPAAGKACNPYNAVNVSAFEAIHSVRHPGPSMLES